MISGEDLRAARVKAGLTQDQLAERLGVGYRTLQGWEASRVKGGNDLKVRTLLGAYLGDDNDVTKLSDTELFLRKHQLDLEIARRLEELRRNARWDQEEAEDTPVLRNDSSSSNVLPETTHRNGVRYGIAGRPE